MASHANIIIYDKLLHIAERFEPYGNTPNLINDADYLDKYLHKIIHTSFPPTTKYLSPSDWMKNIKLQLISDEPNNHQPGDPNGYCLAWCFWFQELKFKNPDQPSSTLLQNFLTKLLSKPSPTNPIITYIRKYASKLSQYSPTTNDPDTTIKSLQTQFSNLSLPLFGR